MKWQGISLIASLVSALPSPQNVYSDVPVRGVEQGWIKGHPHHPGGNKGHGPGYGPPGYHPPPPPPPPPPCPTSSIATGASLSPTSASYGATSLSSATSSTAAPSVTPTTTSLLSSSVSVSSSSGVSLSSGSSTGVSSTSSAVSSTSSSTVAAGAAPSATVSNGVLVGTTTLQTLAKTPSTTATVTKYLGVPFASNPPVRFAAPEPAQPWSSPLDATAFGPACIQPNNTGFGSPAFLNQSESCLYLNIFVPPGANPGDDLPVMFWIFGGNLAFGDAALSFYDGSSFAANQRVILVTHNYRTNIFGFSMSPDVPLEQRNAGFLDQRLALQWVYDNIQAFGGGKEKITVFGESAGGYSVEQLISVPPQPLNFRAAIMESRGFGGPTSGNLSWFNVVGAAGCYLSSDQLGCMRSKDANFIEGVIGSNTFGPVPDDGATFAGDIRPRLTSGQAADVPVLIGTNGNEGSVLTGFGFSADVITAYEFTCLTSLFAQALTASGHPTWRYLYNASFPNTTPFPGAGAYHASEIPEVFGTYPRSGATAQQVALSQYMQGAWASFASNPAAGPDAGWPVYGTEQNVQLIGNDTSVGGQTINASTLDSVCPGYYGLIEQVGYKR